MAGVRLPPSLKKKEEEVTRAIALRQENLRRLESGHAPLPTPEPQVFQRPQPLPEPITPQEPEPQPFAQDVQPQPQFGVDAEELRRQQARADSLQGTLNAVAEERRQEKERAQRELEKAQQREAALAAQIEEMRRKERQAQPLSADDLLRYFKAEQIEEFGMDNCRMLVTAAREISGEATKSTVQSEVQAMREELAALRAENERVQKDAFVRALDAGCPDWRQVNKDPDWIKWLQERDVFTNAPRQHALNEAEAGRDSNRVIAILNAFKATKPQPQVRREPATRVLPTSRTPADLPNETPSVPTLTRQMIDAHQRRYSQDRRYRNSPEAQRLSERIDQAMRDGSLR